MNPEDAVEAFKALGARRFVAMHWGTFKFTDEALREPPVLLREIWQRENRKAGAARDPRHRANAGLLIPGVGSGRSVRAGARRIAERRRGQRESRHRVLPRGASLCAGSRQE